MKKRSFLFTLVIFTMALTMILTACAPAVVQTPEPTNTSVPATSTTVPTLSPAQWQQRPQTTSTYQGELVLWDWSFDPRNQFIQKYITEWESLHPGVTIRYEIMPESDIGSKLSTAIVAGTGPDFSVLNEEWRVEYQRNGMLEPLPKDIFPMEWRNLLFSTPYLTASDGEIYNTSVGAMGAVLYYDKSIFNAAGLTEADLPKTWDQLVTLAQQLTKWNADGTLDQAGFGVNGLNSWLWFDLVVQKGGHFYDPAVTKALWNEQPGVDAAQFITDLYLKYKVTSTKVPWWGDLYCNGKVAMGYNYAWMPGWVSSTCPDKSADLGVAPLPTFEGAPAQGLQLEEDFISVFKSTTPEKKALIWDFIHYLLVEDDSKVLELADDFQVPPDRMDLANDPVVMQNDLLRIGAEVAPYSVHPGPLPIFGDHNGFISTAFDEMLLQNMPVKDALDSAVEQANLDLQSSGKTYSSTEYQYVPPK